YVTQDDDVCVAANARCVSVIATATNTTVARVPIPITGNSVPFWIAITPGGAFAYVTNMITDTGTVLVIDTSTNTVVVTVAVGCCPFEVAITPDGAFAYVTNGAPGTVSVIATATNTVVARVMVGSNAIGVAITSDGTRAYVARGGAVSVIETATNTVTATIPVAAGCGGPYGVAITPDGAFAYVAGGGFGCPGVNDVFVIDTNPLSPTYNTVVATVDVGSQPNHVAITP
ncbi:MAG TPA: YncE family protein, partial [Candidatus Acidoferrales bacterium]|nr:YncE family protein [Candidatus Acidoferrales bacterium]